jgi:5S rRNA maturation endonuclease (ribonuclease M5)
MPLFGSEALDALEPIFVFSEDQLADLLVKLGADYARRQGNNIQANRCFIHRNSSPTLGICIDSPHAFNCFNPLCKGRGPDAIALVSVAMKIDRPSAIAWIYQQFPTIERKKGDIRLFITGSEEEKPPFVLSESVLAAYDPREDKNIGFRAVAYYKNQHGEELCLPEQVMPLGLGYDRINNMLVFPVRHKDGKLAGLIGRAMLRVPSSKRWFNYNEGEFKKAKCLMGYEQQFEKGPLIVVEGPSDYVYLRARGVKNVVATMGSEFSPWQLDAILNIGKDIVPLFDIDEAGIAARRKFTKEVNGRARLLPFKYPDSAFDSKNKADPRNIATKDISALIASFGRITIGKFT